MQFYIEKRLSSHGQACGFYAKIYNDALHSSDPYYLVEASYSNPITVGEDSYSFFLQGGYTTSSGHHSGYCFAIIGTLTKIV